VQSFILVEPMRIPTTSSGKIQRGQCRQQFVDGDFETIAEAHAPLPTDDGGDTAALAKAAALLKLAMVARQQASR
jgi:hypothetical protein